MSAKGEIYTANKNFTLPPAVTALTNSTSGLVFFPWFLGSLGSKKKMRSYDMGCDCGKQKETLAEKTACQKSALLEAPDQVYIILVIIV